MGRTTKDKSSVVGQGALWSEDQLPPPKKLGTKDFKSIRYPLWTENKAKLIQSYLQLFVFITKHGAYIDGFAAPQESERPDMWSAKLVLEMTPKLLRDFWLCDLDSSGAERLEDLAGQHRSKTRRIHVLFGDFNTKVDEILRSGRITEKTATFALLDQRTFECEWQTVQKLSNFKKTGNKIELFYFFPTGWVDRSLAALRKPDSISKTERWWGRSDWRDLLSMDSTTRAHMVARRFTEELGYGVAFPYAIHDSRIGGRVMYHMIHATDHPEASPLMIRAYRKVSGRSETDDADKQTDMDALWKRLETDED